MDLTQPCYDSILHIDKRLEDLQKEVALMEKEYGFKEKHVNLVNTKSTSKTSKPTNKTNISIKSILQQEKTRYNNLPTVKLDEELGLKKQKIVPKISQKWKDVFRKKPDNSYFMEKNKIISIGVEPNDFKPRATFNKEEELFEDYMNDYALHVIKGH